MAFTIIQVTGTFRNPDGTPAAGMVRFTLSSPMYDTSTNEIATVASKSIVWGGAGASFTTPLYANNDPTTTPTGVTYLVEESPTYGKTRTYQVVIPYNAAGGTVDLADLIPVNNSVVSYPVAGPQGIQGIPGPTPTGAANTVLAGPTSGGSAAATMRALVVADVPTLPLSKLDTDIATQAELDTHAALTNNPHAVTAAQAGATAITDLANTADVAKGDALVGFKQSAWAGAVARTVHDKLGEVLSVKDFGAVGNGVTDDATAFGLVATAVNAIANTNGDPVNIFFPEGTYLYTGGLIFTRPVMLHGPGVLNYTGTGKAVSFGPDGLTDATYFNHRRYGADGLQFTGGASMTHGLYFNSHIVEPRVLNCFFHTFGNATAYAIYCQSNNWDTLIADTDFWVPSTAPVLRRNWIRMRGYSATAVADNGNSLLRMTRCHGSNLVGGGIGVWLNGTASTVSQCKIEGFDPNVRIGAWGGRARIVDNYFETIQVTGGDSCIQFGDPVDGDLPNGDLTGLIIERNYANLHFADLAITASLVGYTNNAGMINSRVEANNVASISTIRALIQLVNKAGQTANVARDNRGMTLMHTMGANISSWEGEQGDAPIFRNYQDASLFLNIKGGLTADQTVGLQLLGWNDVLKAQVYFSAGANRVYIQHIGGNKVTSLDATGNWRCDGKTLATGGLGVGNSAAATTPGTVTKKIEVFDANGASIGFIAVYGAIT